MMCGTFDSKDGCFTRQCLVEAPAPYNRIALDSAQGTARHGTSFQSGIERET